MYSYFYPTPQQVVKTIDSHLKCANIFNKTVVILVLAVVTVTTSTRLKPRYPSLKT